MPRTMPDQFGYVLVFPANAGIEGTRYAMALDPRFRAWALS